MVYTQSLPQESFSQVSKKQELHKLYPSKPKDDVTFFDKHLADAFLETYMKQVASHHGRDKPTAQELETVNLQV